MMRRVVFEHGPALFGLVIVDEASLTSTLQVEDMTYYLAQRKTTYDLYRRAITGGGAMTQLDPRQR